MILSHLLIFSNAFFEKIPCVIIHITFLIPTLINSLIALINVPQVSAISSQIIAVLLI